jgi:hypothetical protein
MLKDRRHLSIGSIILAVVTILPATITAIGAWVQSASNGKQLVALKSSLLEQMIMHAENGNNCRSCHRPQGESGRVVAPPTPAVPSQTHPIIKPPRLPTIEETR